MDTSSRKEEDKQVRNLYLHAEMAAWGDNSKKENNQMNWLKERVKEISTWSGASLVALGQGPKARWSEGGRPPAYS